MKKSYFVLPSLLFVFLIGTVSLLSGCGGPYSAPSASSSSGSSGSSSATVMTSADVLTAQTDVSTYGCSGCHTLTLSHPLNGVTTNWTGAGAGSSSNLNTKLTAASMTLATVESYVDDMPASGPPYVPAGDVAAVSEYISYEAGATFVTYTP